PASCDVAIQVCDGGSPDQCAQQTTTVAISPSNDAPVNAVPGVQQIADTGILVFSAGNGNALGVSDPDVGAATNFRSTVSVSSGTVTATASGATLAGNGTSSVQITGTLAQVNAALEGLSFDPVNGVSG